MFNLFHSCFCDLALAWWRLIGLLDEAVQHDDASANERAEEHSAYSFSCLKPQLEEAVTDGLGMGLSEVWT